MPKTESKVDDIEKTRKIPQVPWTPFTAIVVVVAVYFGSQLAGGLALVAFGLARGMSSSQVENWLADSSATGLQFANSVIVYGLMAAAVYWFARKYKVSLRVFGVVKPRFVDIGIALMALLPYILGYALLLYVMTKLFPSIDAQQKQQLGFDASRITPIGLAFAFISLVVLPPLIEELVMRGFLFTSLLKKYSFVIAALITSAIFASPHLQIGTGAPPLWTAALDTFILSLALCFVRYKTGSLWPAIFLHAFKNGAAFLAIFVFRV